MPTKHKYIKKKTKFILATGWEKDLFAHRSVLARDMTVQHAHPLRPGEGSPDSAGLRAHLELRSAQQLVRQGHTSTFIGVQVPVKIIDYDEVKQVKKSLLSQDNDFNVTLNLWCKNK